MQSLVVVGKEHATVKEAMHKDNRKPDPGIMELRGLLHSIKNYT